MRPHLGGLAGLVRIGVARGFLHAAHRLLGVRMTVGSLTVRGRKIDL